MALRLMMHLAYVLNLRSIHLPFLDTVLVIICLDKKLYKTK